MSSPAPITANVPPPKTAGRRGMMLRILLVVVVLGLIGWGAWYFLEGRWYESTDDAYVSGNVVQVTPLVAGTVTSINADDGSSVRSGQLLVQLDASDSQAVLAQSAANLARTVRQVRGVYSGIGSSQALLAARRVDLEKARADYARRQQLAGTGAISTEELAHAHDQLAAAETALSAASEQNARDRTQVDDNGVAEQPDVSAAAAQFRQAWLANARARIVAPVAGYVARRSVQLGQRVQPGSPLMAVVPLEQVWVDANFKETQLRRMRIGQPVELHADLYGGSVDYKGTVASLGVGTGSAFSLLPAQNASGNWIKIVQRLPVRIVLDAKQVREHPLRIGLSMSADVDLHGDKGASLPAPSPEQALLATDVYAHQLQEADAEANRIIAANIPGATPRAAAHATANR